MASLVLAVRQSACSATASTVVAPSTMRGICQCHKLLNFRPPEWPQPAESPWRPRLETARPLPRGGARAGRCVGCGAPVTHPPPARAASGGRHGLASHCETGAHSRGGLVGRDDLDDCTGLIDAHVGAGLHQAAASVARKVIANSVAPAGDDLTIGVHRHGRIAQH